MTKARVNSLIQRVGTLEKMLTQAGVQVPEPTESLPGIRERPVYDNETRGSDESVSNVSPRTTQSLPSLPSLPLPPPPPPPLRSAAPNGAPSPWTPGPENDGRRSSAAIAPSPGRPSENQGHSPAESIGTNSSLSSTTLHPAAQRRLRAGSMGIDMAGRGPRYYGVTTNYHIYSNMYHLENESAQREHEVINERTRAFLATIHRDTYDYLMDRFWMCYNMVIHVVHRRAFELHWNSGSDRYYSGFLHVCMLAIGYRYADRTKHGVQRFATPDRESDLHKEAKRLVDHELKMPGGIPSLQSLILLGDLECGIGKYNTGWMYAGMASRLVFDLGLNRDCSRDGLSDIEMQVRKTALWACVTIDRQVIPLRYLMTSRRRR